MIKLDSKIPEGPLAEKWSKHKFNVKLVNPANKRKYEIEMGKDARASSELMRANDLKDY